LRVVPYNLTKAKKEHHVNLLLIQPEDTDMDIKQEVPDDSEADHQGPIPYHYVWIKNISRLLYKQNSKHDGKMYFFERCLHGYHSHAKLEAHEVDCTQVNECRVTMPKVFEDKSGNKGHVVKFKNFGYKTKVPFVVYADFESLLKKVHQPQTREQPKGASEEHEPFSCAFYVQFYFDFNQSEFKTYRGLDPGIWLAEELQKLGRAVEILYNNKIDMPPLSPEEEEKFKSAPLCHMREKPFKPTDTRVHDHNHLTGKKFTLNHYFTHQLQMLTLLFLFRSLLGTRSSGL